MDDAPLEMEAADAVDEDVVLDAKEIIAHTTLILDHAPPNQLHWELAHISLYHIPFQERIPFWGLIQYVITRFLENEQEYGEQVLCHAWRISAEWMRMPPEDEDADNTLAKDELRDHLVRAGYIDLIQTELMRLPRRERVLELAISPLSDLGLNPSAAALFVSKRLIDPLLALAREFKFKTVAIRSLIALANIALFPVSHEAFLANENEPIRIAIGMLDGLESDDLNELDCAITAAFIICRVCGTDEQGPGTEYIHKRNALFLKRLHWLLKSVMESDGFRFLNAHWDPANILYDVATLSLSDRNKPLLLGFLPLILHCLVVFKRVEKNNPRAVQYSVEILFNLQWDPTCFAALLACKNEICAHLEELGATRTTTTITLETFQQVEALKSRLMMGDALQE